MSKRHSSQAPSRAKVRAFAPEPEKPPLPPKFLFTSVAATLNLTAGGLGLVFPESFPALARPAVVLTLIVFGVGLEIWAIRLLLAARRTPQTPGHMR